MANAAIYYYPQGGGDMITVDLGGCLQALEADDITDSVDNRAKGGRWYGQTYRAAKRVTVRKEGITTESIARKLENVQHHLATGGWIGIAEDADKAFAAFVANGRRLKSGRLKVRTFQNAFWNQSAGLAASDEVEVLQLLSPWKRHRDVIATSAPGVYTLTDGIAGNMRDSGMPTLLRHRGFWPILRLPPGNRGGVSILRNRYRIAWTLELELEEDLDSIRSLSAVGSAPLGTLEFDRNRPRRIIRQEGTKNVTPVENGFNLRKKL